MLSKTVGLEEAAGKNQQNVLPIGEASHHWTCLPTLGQGNEKKTQPLPGIYEVCQEDENEQPPATTQRRTVPCCTLL